MALPRENKSIIVCYISFALAAAVYNFRLNTSVPVRGVAVLGKRRSKIDTAQIGSTN